MSTRAGATAPASGPWYGPGATAEVVEDALQPHVTPDELAAITRRYHDAFHKQTSYHPRQAA
jgi:hypothetical protein